MTQIQSPLPAPSCSGKFQMRIKFKPRIGKHPLNQPRRDGPPAKVKRTMGRPRKRSYLGPAHLHPDLIDINPIVRLTRIDGNDLHQLLGQSSCHVNQSTYGSFQPPKPKIGRPRIHPIVAKEKKPRGRPPWKHLLAKRKHAGGRPKKNSAFTITQSSVMSNDGIGLTDVQGHTSHTLKPVFGSLSESAYHSLSADVWKQPGPTDQTMDHIQPADDPIFYDQTSGQLHHAAGQSSHVSNPTDSPHQPSEPTIGQLRKQPVVTKEKKPRGRPPWKHLQVKKKHAGGRPKKNSAWTVTQSAVTSNNGTGLIDAQGHTSHTIQPEVGSLSDNAYHCLSSAHVQSTDGLRQPGAIDQSVDYIQPVSDPIFYDKTSGLLYHAAAQASHVSYPTDSPYQPSKPKIGRPRKHPIVANEKKPRGRPPWKHLQVKKKHAGGRPKKNIAFTVTQSTVTSNDGTGLIDAQGHTSHTIQPEVGSLSDSAYHCLSSAHVQSADGLRQPGTIDQSMDHIQPLNDPIFYDQTSGLLYHAAGQSSYVSHPTDSPSQPSKPKIGRPRKHPIIAKEKKPRGRPPWKHLQIKKKHAGGRPKKNSAFTVTQSTVTSDDGTRLAYTQGHTSHTIKQEVGSLSDSAYHCLSSAHVQSTDGLKHPGPIEQSMDYIQPVSDPIFYDKTSGQFYYDAVQSCHVSHPTDSPSQSSKPKIGRPRKHPIVAKEKKPRGRPPWKHLQTKKKHAGGRPKKNSTFSVTQSAVTSNDRTISADAPGHIAHSIQPEVGSLPDTDSAYHCLSSAPGQSADGLKHPGPTDQSMDQIQPVGDPIFYDNTSIQLYHAAGQSSQVSYPNDSPYQPSKPKIGRPRKHPIVPKEKKPIGRPRKHPIAKKKHAGGRPKKNSAFSVTQSAVTSDDRTISADAPGHIAHSIQPEVGSLPDTDSAYHCLSSAHVQSADGLKHPGPMGQSMDQIQPVGDPIFYDNTSIQLYHAAGQSSHLSYPTDPTYQPCKPKIGRPRKHPIVPKEKKPIGRPRKHPIVKKKHAGGRPVKKKHAGGRPKKNSAFTVTQSTVTSADGTKLADAQGCTPHIIKQEVGSLLGSAYHCLSSEHVQSADGLKQPGPTDPAVDPLTLEDGPIFYDTSLGQLYHAARQSNHVSHQTPFPCQPPKRKIGRPRKHPIVAKEKKPRGQTRTHPIVKKKHAGGRPKKNSTFTVTQSTVTSNDGSIFTDAQGHTSDAILSGFGSLSDSAYHGLSSSHVESADGLNISSSTDQLTVPIQPVSDPIFYNKSGGLYPAVGQSSHVVYSTNLPCQPPKPKIGRPRKHPIVVKVKKPRGQPRTHPIDLYTGQSSHISYPTDPPCQPPKPKIGRPRKHPIVAKEKKPRGQPRIHPMVKKKHAGGRPKKNSTFTVTQPTSNAESVLTDAHGHTSRVIQPDVGSLSGGVYHGISSALVQSPDGVIQSGTTGQLIDLVQPVSDPIFYDTSDLDTDQVLPDGVPALPSRTEQPARGMQPGLPLTMKMPTTMATDEGVISLNGHILDQPSISAKHLPLVEYKEGSQLAHPVLPQKVKRPVGRPRKHPKPGTSRRQSAGIIPPSLQNSVICGNNSSTIGEGSHVISTPPRNIENLKIKRPVGRPRKHVKVANIAVVSAGADVDVNNASQTAQLASDTVIIKSEPGSLSTAQPKPNHMKGTPRKRPNKYNSTLSVPETPGSVKRKVGRPRKHPAKPKGKKPMGRPRKQVHPMTISLGGTGSNSLTFSGDNPVKSLVNFAKKMIPTKSVCNEEPQNNSTNMEPKPMSLSQVLSNLNLTMADITVSKLKKEHKDVPRRDSVGKCAKGSQSLPAEHEMQNLLNVPSPNTHVPQGRPRTHKEPQGISHRLPAKEKKPCGRPRKHPLREKPRGRPRIHPLPENQPRYCKDTSNEKVGSFQGHHDMSDQEAARMGGYEYHAQVWRNSAGYPGPLSGVTSQDYPNTGNYLNGDMNQALTMDINHMALCAAEGDMNQIMNQNCDILHSSPAQETLSSVPATDSCTLQIVESRSLASLQILQQSRSLDEVPPPHIEQFNVCPPISQSNSPCSSVTRNHGNVRGIPSRHVTMSYPSGPSGISNGHIQQSPTALGSYVPSSSSGQYMQKGSCIFTVNSVSSQFSGPAQNPIVCQEVPEDRAIVISPLATVNSSVPNMARPIQSMYSHHPAPHPPIEMLDCGILGKQPINIVPHEQRIYEVPSEQTRQTVEVVDLCSDSEDEEPVGEAVQPLIIYDSSEEGMPPIQAGLPKEGMPPIQTGLPEEGMPPIQTGLPEEGMPPIQTGLPEEGVPPIQTGLPKEGVPPIQTGLPEERMPPIQTGLPEEGMPPIQTGLPEEGVPPIQTDLPEEGMPPIQTDLTEEGMPIQTGLLEEGMPSIQTGRPEERMPPMQTDLTEEGMPYVQMDLPTEGMPPIQTDLNEERISPIQTDLNEESISPIQTDLPEEGIPLIQTVLPEEGMPPIQTDLPEEGMPPIQTDLPEDGMPHVQTDFPEEWTPPIQTGLTEEGIPPIQTDLPEEGMPHVQTDLPEEGMPPIQADLPEEGIPPIQTDLPEEGMPPIQTDLTEEGIPPIQTDLPEEGMPPIQADLPEEGIPPIQADLPEEGMPHVQTDLHEEGMPPIHPVLTEEGMPPIQMGLLEEGMPSIQIGCPEEGMPPIQTGLTEEGMPPFQTDLPEEGLPRIQTDLPEEGMSHVQTDLPGEGMPHVQTDIPEEGVSPTQTDLPEEGLPHVQTDLPGEGMPHVQTDVPEEGVSPIQTDLPEEGLPHVQTDLPGEGMPHVQTDVPEEGVSPFQTDLPEESLPHVQTDLPEDTGRDPVSGEGAVPLNGGVDAIISDVTCMSDILIVDGEVVTITQSSD